MTLIFAPLVPTFVLIAMMIAAIAVCALTFASKKSGRWLRISAVFLALSAIANPILSQEEREPVKNIVAILVDKSQSQLLQDRSGQTDKALAQLEMQLSKLKDLEVRVRRVDNDLTKRPSTKLFSALSEEISDIPSNRLAGTILITDGQVHDIPENLKKLGIQAPFHSIITGEEKETDLRVEIIQSPRFGLVGETQELEYTIHLDGARRPEISDHIEVELRLNGEILSTEIAPINEKTTAFIDIPRRGQNLIELSIKPINDEVSLSNNKALAEIEGVRENLRVLLVSGAPHSGERAWRNLLKSDTSIDLVHFTILRPPDRNDGTPIDELSLIAFPTRELFVEKVDEFDLIIFDRYQRLGVLSVLYYDNIARYVEEGGALLIAAGPEFAGIRSIATTPLSPVLPADPTGNVTQIGFYPRISDIGLRHPVSRDLEGGVAEPPAWGRWFRSIDVSNPKGYNVLNGPDGKPLLILDRVNDGRVAMLLSDHGWLWSRGFEGGGPHISLYRRIAHWLMKEPNLEEEALFATANAKELLITRQTMNDQPPQVTITSPSGAQEVLTLEEKSVGKFEFRKQISEMGLYQVRDGELSALAHAGTMDAPEFQEVFSTTQTLTPISLSTGGITTRLVKNGNLSLPQIVPVRQIPSRQSDRMFLRASTETILVGVKQFPLLSGLLGLAILLMIMSATWFREGR